MQYFRKSPRTVARDASIRDAARLMDEHGVGCLLVPDAAQRPVGIVTDRDVVLRGLQRRRSLDEATVSSVMSPVVGKAREGTPLPTATLRMGAEGVRRLPVIDAHGKLSGLLTYDDALQYVAGHLSAAAESIRAQFPKDESQPDASQESWEVPTARHYCQVPVAVRPDAQLLEAVDEMAEYGVGCVVVVDEGNLPVGILTDRDVLRRVVAAGLDENKTTVVDVMTTDPVTAPEDSSLAEVLQRTKTHAIRRLPLVSHRGELTAFVALDDVIAQLESELAHLTSAVRVEMRESTRLTRERRQHRSSND